MTTIRVVLPPHLRTLARVEDELHVNVAGAPTIEQVLDAVESSYPMLRGTIRDHGTAKRRAFIRFFACGRDLSHAPTDARLPDPVVSGAEAFCVIGAIAGG